MNHIPTVSDGPLLKSYLAALKADMTPTCIDGQTGYFSSRHGNYVVTLDVPNGCVCGSHTRPCKHQYRLAMELNLMSGDFIHDPSKIKYKLDGVDFETAVDRIEQLPATAQKELFGILSSLFNGKVYSGTLSEDSARALVGGNVLLWIDDPAGYRLCTDLDKSSFMLDKYLRRKFDFDIYFDPYNRGTFSVPHGCTAVYDEDDPGHPYTVGLLRSMPRVDAESYERLIPIEGTPVDMLNPPEGCPFAPRCEHAMKICLQKMPPYVELGNQHRSACWLRVQDQLEREKTGTGEVESHE